MGGKLASAPIMFRVMKVCLGEGKEKEAVRRRRRGRGGNDGELAGEERIRSEKGVGEMEGMRRREKRWEEMDRERRRGR